MVVAILTAAIAVSGYVSNLIWAHNSEQSVRESLRFYSDSINKGMGQLMMSGNNERIKVLIDEMSRDSKVYGDIRLISHHSGKVVASRFGEGSTFKQEDTECAICHDREDLGGDPNIVDMVTELSDGRRTLCVMAPIINEKRCGGCHEGDPPILGFLSVDYSLRQIDAPFAFTEVRFHTGGSGLLSQLQVAPAEWLKVASYCV